ncbi:MAG: glycoside hydrolase family 88 protein [Tannerella sp.]|jgi:rhamnogalacturonyl hydrolase YesR|nr:glycoside hydrolase family 88 protein [Tannerella sp.]
MINRRHFLRNTSLAFSGAMLGSCSLSGTSPAKTQPVTSLAEKAKNAMLAMQRASWEQGTAIQAMIECADYEMLRLLVNEAVLRQAPDGRTCMLGSDNNVTDPVAAGYGILKCHELFGDERYKQAADRLYNYCKNTAPRNDAGTVYHVNNHREIWSDSIYMLPPFLAAYGDYDECLKQIRGYRDCLWNADKKLFSHRWSDDENRFINAHCWGGGNGWAAAAFAIIYELLPAEQQAYKTEISAYLVELLDGLQAAVLPDGLFNDFVGEADSFVETNLAQMAAFAIFKSVKSGAIDAEYLEFARQMKAGALSKVDEYGYLQGAAGSPTFNAPGTSTEAQAFLLMMLAAEEKLTA